MTLTRSGNGMIAGVAAGIAKGFNLDVTVVRLVFVLVSIFMGGGLLLYLALWALLPRESDGGIVAEEGFRKARAWYHEQRR